jgi:hypothetical protein
MKTTQQKIELSSELYKIAHKIRILENMIVEAELDAEKLRKTSPFFSETEHKKRIIQMETMCLKLESDWNKITKNDI